MRTNNLPELLSPAGSPEALRAAVAGGADAVYFGAKSFSARSFAENFDDDAIKNAVCYCRALGVKTYMTVNVQLSDRELKDAAETIFGTYRYGVDAFIVADVGLASYVHTVCPEIELHASTQATGLNVYSADELKKIGFSRMVAPREISRRDLEILIKKSPIETELFVHGAMCVSCSGQCLMSSVIGGRSGNRGECAQPCRLPYGKNGYALSLKDMCLAEHLTELSEMGVASLKIEGRMKSPEYVYGVTKIYRTLLDEGRNAGEKEIAELSALFSRSGFTCGYYTGKIDREMLGVRTADDKKESAKLSGAAIPEKKAEIFLRADIKRGVPATVVASGTFFGNKVMFTASGDVPEAAGSSMSPERVRESLAKLGGTPFFADPENITVNIDDGLRMSVAQINALRRNACEGLLKKLSAEKHINLKSAPPLGKRTSSDMKTAYFADVNNIPDEAQTFFDRIFVPLAVTEKAYKNVSAERLGIAFPPVALDTETAEIEKMAERAKALGIRYALVTGMWQIPICRRLGFEMTGDLRLNVWNSQSAEKLYSMGISGFIQSCEIGLARGAAMQASGRYGAVAYGRLPLMTLEKCVIRDIMNLPAEIEKCNFCGDGKFVFIKDRTGAEFPIRREFRHRNVLYNSVPVRMEDRLSEYTRAGLFQHFIFTCESKKEVAEIICAYKIGGKPNGAFKRI